MWSIIVTATVRSSASELGEHTIWQVGTAWSPPAANHHRAMSVEGNMGSAEELNSPLVVGGERADIHLIATGAARQHGQEHLCGSHLIERSEHRDSALVDDGVCLFATNEQLAPPIEEIEEILGPSRSPDSQINPIEDGEVVGGADSDRLICRWRDWYRSVSAQCRMEREPCLRVAMQRSGIRRGEDQARTATVTVVKGVFKQRAADTAFLDGWENSEGRQNPQFVSTQRLGHSDNLTALLGNPRTVGVGRSEVSDPLLTLGYRGGCSRQDRQVMC